MDRYPAWTVEPDTQGLYRIVEEERVIASGVQKAKAEYIAGLYCLLALLANQSMGAA